MPQPQPPAIDSALEPVARHAEEFFIDGAWMAPHSDRTIEVIDPATERPLGTVALGDTEDVDSAVAAARRAFATFSRTSKDERVGLLRSVIAAYKANIDQIGDVVSLEMGAPTALARRAQALSGYGHLKATLAALEADPLEEVLGSTTVVYEPVGVCALITPWNWPLNQIAAKVAPALASGCTMVLKPSEVAPFSAIFLARILDEAGIPAGVFNLVNGDGPIVGAALAAHPDVDMISFTGSTRAGIEIARAAAPTVKRVTQELGGKSANILVDDAGFADALARDVAESFVNSGQSCNAATRLLVPAERMDEAAVIAGRATDAVVVGPPGAEGTEVGPVVSFTQFEKVQSLIEGAVQEGATLVSGGPGRPDGLDDGYYVRPTVFADVTKEMAIAREEIFGPVVTLIGYRDEDEAVEIANDTPFGLSGKVSALDHGRAREIARRVRTGMVHINGAPLTSDAPFGGYGESGNGREYGAHGLREFLEAKSIYGDRPIVV